MTNKLENYNYSKQYLLIENEGTKAYKKINSNKIFQNLDDYQYKVISTVIQREVDSEIYSLIQYEDKEIGWVNLKNSVQIFRHKAQFYKVHEEKFQSSELSDEMNIKKDFIAHFKGKLLNIKSELFYKGEKHLGVFINNKFHGFHPAKYFDPMIETDLIVPAESILNEIKLYKQSSLTSEVANEFEIKEINIIAIFKSLGILKIKFENEKNYWTDSKYFPSEMFEEINLIDKNETQRFIDDLLYSVNLERFKTKEIAKTILSAKEFLAGSTEEANDFKAQGSILYEDEIEELKEENKQYKKEIRQENNDRKLAENRLSYQLDYKVRVEAQRDKYKARMQVVEEKMKLLVEKNKKLKQQLESKK